MIDITRIRKALGCIPSPYVTVMSLQEQFSRPVFAYGGQLEAALLSWMLMQNLSGLGVSE